MTTFPNSAKLIKGGIVLIDPRSAQIQPNGLDHPEQNGNAVQYGIASQFAALEPQRVGENLAWR